MTDEPFHELSQFHVDPPSVRGLPRPYCLQNHVVILGSRDADPVLVGMLDPSDRGLVAEIEKVLGRGVSTVRLNAYEIERAVGRGYDDGSAAAASDRFRLALRPVRELSYEKDTPITQLLNEILGRAVNAGASDVHIECYEADVDVRYRVDGVLRQVATALSRDNVSAAVSRLKVLAGLDISERRTAQDGRIRATYEADDRSRLVDFRLSIVPGPFGEDAVLRILDSAMTVVGLGDLGIAPGVLAVLERIVANPEGLIVVTGPTGSGKTTTLYAALHRLCSAEKKILTAENPIEYHFDKVNQKQVTAQMGFAAYARAFLRQNPDVIMIGEVRDEETADVALRAAQTGHLVLTTLHAADAVRTVSRLATLGVDGNLLANSLLGVVAQRLARRVCAACRVPCEATADEAERLSLPATDRSFYEGKGCDRCRGRGYRGRVGIFELFVPDDEIGDLVTSGAPAQRIWKRAVQIGMVTMMEDALAKARAGETSLREILRIVPYRLIQRQR